jgi:PadR family transcriptional regulator PadR
MKGTNLGEFEEIVLLTVAALIDEAYSVSICDEIKKSTGRNVKLGVVHAVLNRLEKKGYIVSSLGEATKVRGGRRKRFFQITHGGKEAVLRARDQRERLWQTIPDIVFKGLNYA